MSIREIRCEACRTLNRLPDYSVRRIPECGRCHARLPETRSATTRRMIYRFRVQIAAAPMAAILVWVALVAMTPGRGTQTLAGATRTTTAPSAAACGQSLSQGLNVEYDGAENAADFTITTSPGPFYLVKLDRVAADSSPLLSFIQGGQSLNTRVPLGEFKLKYATGTNWCADAGLFSDDTVFSEANDTFIFSSSHLTVELPLQRDGEVMTKEISRNEFYSR